MRGPARISLLLSALLFAVAVPQPTAAFTTFTYTAYDFGPDIAGNVWNVWAANGSNVWDWHTDYVDGYLHYSFKIHNQLGLYCSGSCRVHLVWDTDPTAGFTQDNLKRFEFSTFPESNSNDHIYSVDIQWSSSGYRVVAYDETTNEVFSDQSHTYPTTPTTFDAFAPAWDWSWYSGTNVPLVYSESTPALHAANFSPHLSGEEVTGLSGGGIDIRTPALPVMQATPPAPSVLFIPGIQGSILKIGSETIWPTNAWRAKVPYLALTNGGESQYPVIADGLVETFFGVPVYDGFVSFMDELVASGTSTTWRALPYDWRFSPDRVLADGIQTPSGIIDPVAQVEELAALSGTGKVAIVAHSMGGLVGKALIKKLESLGEADLIESFVMIGTPQLGTPETTLTLLHGDIGFWGNRLIVHPSITRDVVRNFESVYDLLPSPGYFDETLDPVFKFATTSSFTQEWRDHWGDTVNVYSSFFEFLTGTGVSRSRPLSIQTRIPEVLRTDLTLAAQDFHTTYANYTIPDSIRVVQVAGWGLPTPKGIEYKDRHLAQNYETLYTREGDETVVYPSALHSDSNDTYFFNLFTYNNTYPDVKHRNILNASFIQTLIASALKSSQIIESELMTKVKPPVTDIEDQLVISTHSPVILGVLDQNDNFTGIDPNQDLGADLLTIAENISDSTFFSFGDSQYIFLPEEGSYTASFTGIGSGLTTVEISSFSNDIQNLIVSYTDIPVATGTVATFNIDSSAPQNTRVDVDSNGDGDQDLIFTPDGTDPPITELFALLKQKISVLDIKESRKKNILKKIGDYEKKVAKVKNKKALKIVSTLLQKIILKLEKSQVPDVDVQEVEQLLEELESKL